MEKGVTHKYILSRAFIIMICLIFIFSSVSSAGAKIPDNKQLQSITLEALMKFNEAVRIKSFNKFHAFISKFWQKQITSEELKGIFQAFIDAEIDLSPIRNLEAVFDVSPWISDDGWLEVIGHYPSMPSRTAFNLTYLQEKGKWKLVGINVQVYAPDKLVPFDPVLAEMAQETLINFSRAIRAKDFTAFHRSISTLWRQQTTPDELKEAFKTFIDNDFSLKEVEKVKPQIDPGASIEEYEEYNVLNFSGVFSLDEGTLRFSLQYLMEAGEWKLAAINVNIK